MRWFLAENNLEAVLYGQWGWGRLEQVKSEVRACCARATLNCAGLKLVQFLVSLGSCHRLCCSGRKARLGTLVWGIGVVKVLWWWRLYSAFLFMEGCTREVLRGLAGLPTIERVRSTSQAEILTHTSIALHYFCKNKLLGRWNTWRPEHANRK